MAEPGPAEAADRPSPVAWLASPLPMAGLLLMGLNDHWLRIRWPGFLTGKLSDLGVLCFLPALLCAGWVALRRLLPGPGDPGPTPAQIWACSGLAGAALVLLNLSPPARDLYVGVLAALTGQRHAYVCDPSDCLALAILPLVVGDGLRRCKSWHA